MSCEGVRMADQSAGRVSLHPCFPQGLWTAYTEITGEGGTPALFLSPIERDRRKIMGALIVFIVIVAVVYGYVVAFKKVKTGEITVYKDWRDFGWSVAWLFCLFVGFVLWMIGGVNKSLFLLMNLLAIVCMGMMAISVFHLIRGAFALNTERRNAWLALHARFVGSIFTFGIVGLIWQEDGSDSRHKPNLIMELLWVLLYCWVFKTCLLPLIKDNGQVKVAEEKRGNGKPSIRSPKFEEMCDDFMDAEDDLLEFLDAAGNLDEDSEENDIDELEEMFDNTGKPGAEKMMRVVGSFKEEDFEGSERELFCAFVEYADAAMKCINGFDKFMCANDDDLEAEKEFDTAADNFDKLGDKLREMGWRQ